MLSQSGTCLGRESDRPRVLENTMYPSETRNVCLSYLSEEGPPVPGLRPSSFAAAASLSQTIIVPGNVLNLSNKFSSLVKVGPTSRVYCLFGTTSPGHTTREPPVSTSGLEPREPLLISTFKFTHQASFKIEAGFQNLNRRCSGSERRSLPQLV